MKTVWLSHPIDNATPLYGGSTDIRIKKDKDIGKGDSCNTSFLEMPSHAGTHVDAPYHFVDSGRTIDAYAPDAFIFKFPEIIDVPVADGELIFPETVSSELSGKTDLVLFRTGFEEKRGMDVYWQAGPGLAPEMMDFLALHCPDLKAVGMDFISISSLKHRQTGRKAHQAFLSRNIMLFEDMRLADLDSNQTLTQVIALPMRFHRGDGGPCTIVGFIE